MTNGAPESETKDFPVKETFPSPASCSSNSRDSLGRPGMPAVRPPGGNDSCYMLPGEYASRSSGIEGMCHVKMPQRPIYIETLMRWNLRGLHAKTPCNNWFGEGSANILFVSMRERWC